jgi:hypothetical protein
MHRSASNTRLALALLVAPALLTGCQSKPPQIAEWDDEARGETNAWMLRTYFDKQVENGVVRQHTLWSHHFVDGTASLNERGERDLHILAQHYIRHNGGILNLPRNGTPHDLYNRRTTAVRESLAEAGVNVAAVVLETDTWAGQTQSGIRAGSDFVRPSDPSPFTFHEGSSQ